jgi:hypothetical protein
VAIMRPIRGRGRYGHARRYSDTPPISVKVVECAVLDPVPFPQRKAVPAQFGVATLNRVHSPTLRSRLGVVNLRFFQFGL